jgi:hypothetical protein
VQERFQYDQKSKKDFSEKYQNSTNDFSTTKTVKTIAVVNVKKNKSDFSTTKTVQTSSVVNVKRVRTISVEETWRHHEIGRILCLPHWKEGEGRKVKEGQGRKVKEGRRRKEGGGRKVEEGR